MKKSIALSGVFILLMLFVFSSCKKDWTCECSATGITSSSAEISKKTKKNAQDDCDALAASYKAAGGNCTLKAK